MALGLTSEIILKKELRPCIVNGQKALFHGWQRTVDYIPPLKDKHLGGITEFIIGIIERGDGTIHKAYPEEIRFIDMAVNDYFRNHITALNFEKQEGAGENKIH